MNKKKFRPSLTQVQVAYLHSLIRADYIATSSQEALSLLNIFTILQAKIETGSLKPSYIPSLKVKEPSSVESLSKELFKTASLATGSDAIGKSILAHTHTLAGFETKEAYWEAAYNKYISTEPLGANCTIQELQATKEHMYLNDLMTPLEVVSYEESTL